MCKNDKNNRRSERTKVTRVWTKEPKKLVFEKMCKKDPRS